MFCRYRTFCPLTFGNFGDMIPVLEENTARRLFYGRKKDTYAAIPAGGPDARNVLENHSGVLAAGDTVLSAPADLHHQRRGHRGTDPDGSGGGGCQRHQLTGVHLFAVCLRRQRGLLCGDILPRGGAGRPGRPPQPDHPDRAVGGTDGGADGAGSGAAEPHAGVDQRDAGGTPRSITPPTPTASSSSWASALRCSTTLSARSCGAWATL